MATKGTRLLNSILGLEDEEENVNVGGGEQQGVYSNVPRVQAKHSGLHVGNLDNDYTNDEDDKDVGKGTVLADDGNYKSPYETKEGIKQVEDGTRQQEDNTDPNKGMENDKVDVTPVKTTEGTQNGDTYRTMEDIAKVFQTRADEEEKESQENEAELKRTAKRRMLLAGIADAANSFHQAYAYARGIKPMNENKGYAKEVRKELREDLDWLRKNKDRVLNYRAKVAEIQGTIASLKNQDKLAEERLSKERRAQRESDAKIKAYEARANKDDELANLYMAKAEAVRNGDVNKEREIDAKIKVYESQERRNDASANASNARAEQIRNGTYVEEEKTDETGMTSKTTRKTQPLSAGTSSNSNAGMSNRNGGLGWGKDDNKTDW